MFEGILKLVCNSYNCFNIYNLIKFKKISAFTFTAGDSYEINMIYDNVGTTQDISSLRIGSHGGFNIAFSRSIVDWKNLNKKI